MARHSPLHTPLPCRMTVREHAWPLRRAFSIARGSRTMARTIIVELADSDGHVGRGEAVPYARHGETVEQALADLQQARSTIENGLTPPHLHHVLRTLAARTAVDCALWDLAAKHAGAPVWKLAGLPRPQPRTTACTISLNSADHMATETHERAAYPLLKLKLGGKAEDDLARLNAVRAARPDARLIVDANEGWRAPDAERLLKACAQAGVEMVEQPLPAGEDDLLERMDRPVPVCADESLHDVADIARLRGRYDAVNIKLDKAGGFTPALEQTVSAKNHGYKVMIGCMLASSLAMAPAFLLTAHADWIDLDGPLLLAEDMPPAIRYEGALMHPPAAALWGG